MLNKIDANHFALTTSIPLLPLKRRRDILLFHSLPTATYLSAEDRGVRQTWLGERRQRAEAPSPTAVRRPPRLPSRPLVDSPIEEARTETPESLAVTNIQQSSNATQQVGGQASVPHWPDAGRFGLPDMPSTANAETAASTLARQLSQSASPTDDMRIVVGPPTEHVSELSPFTEAEVARIHEAPKIEPTIESLDEIRPSMQLRRRASSWVLEDAPSILPDPQPIRDLSGRWINPSGIVPTEPSNLVIDVGPPGSKKKGLGRLFHRPSKSENLHDRSPDEACPPVPIVPATPIYLEHVRLQTQPPLRTETTYTAAGLAGVGTYLKTPLGRADPPNHQPGPAMSSTAIALNSDVVLPPTSLGETKFVEQLRDTMLVPLEWIGIQERTVTPPPEM